MKKIFSLIVIILTIFCLCACSSQKEEQGLDSPPDVRLSWQQDDERFFTALRLGYTWNFPGKDDEMITQIADSPHPLDILSDLPVIEKEEVLDKILLIFDDQMNDFTLYRYETTATYEEKESVEVVNNQFAIINQNGSSVYELYVEYEQGKANYAFLVK